MLSLPRFSPDEVARLAVDAPVVLAGEVPLPGSLHLDDAGTEVGQVPGGERCRDGVLERDHGDARQRQRSWLLVVAGLGGRHERTGWRLTS